MAACNPGDVIGCVVQYSTNSAADSFAKSIALGFDTMVKEFVTSWLGQGMLIDLSGMDVEWFRYSLSSVTFLLAVLGIVVGGMVIMFRQRGEAVQAVAAGFARFVLVSTMGTAVISILILTGDSLGKWALDSAGVSTATFVVAAASYTASPGVTLTLGLIGIIAVACQWGVMILRGALLPLLIGFWPTLAAAAIAKSGEQAFEKVTAWILAFTLYTPLSAYIYAFAWRTNAAREGVGGIVTAVVLIALAVAALPALLRLLVPAMSGLGKMSGGTVAVSIASAGVAAGVAAGSAFATGGASAGAGGGGSAAITSRSSTAASGGQTTAGGKATSGDGATSSSKSTTADGAASSKDSGPSSGEAYASGSTPSSSGSGSSASGTRAAFDGAQAGLGSRTNSDNSAEGAVTE